MAATASYIAPCTIPPSTLLLAGGRRGLGPGLNVLRIGSTRIGPGPAVMAVAATPLQ